MAGNYAYDNAKKAAGNAKKAANAAKKARAQEVEQEAAESKKWEKGSKDNSKKEAEAAKKAEQARKKAERDALAKEEAAGMNQRAEAKKSFKAAPKKSRGLDLSQLDDSAGSGSGKGASISASGIDNALDALSLTAGGDDNKVDRHPERRFAAAFAKYEERRLDEMKKDGSGVGLRLEQRKQRIRKEFEKSPENPFNQVTAAYNASRGDLADIKAQEMAKIEKRLAH
ncbi:Coiled-coil domain-containing protein 124 -like protein [Escovopsis weberi]|uniref:Coiled-coil domain-containing protein 124-like protein n=1 Tax=Escovopsis weberi TaxID=150374 RepID=A0A0M8N138_ESCWE|nr:Coiled-coil domain-containing protein 124 -like protein [Escovopsis weberi]